MRLYPNLHGDLSAGSGFNAITRDAEFGFRFMEEFQDRLYFGTDIANVPQELPIVEFFKRIKEQNFISQEAFEKISWANAAKLLGLSTDINGIDLRKIRKTGLFCWRVKYPVACCGVVDVIS